MPVSERENAYAAFADDPSFLSQLLDGLAGATASKNVVSWFLKKHLETGAFLDPAQVRGVYESAVHFDDWEAMLHVLQSIPHLGVRGSSRAPAERFVRRCLEHGNRFVRAWARSGVPEPSCSPAS